MRDATFVVPSVVNIRSMDCRSPANKISIDRPVPHMVDFGDGLKLAVPKRSPGVTVCMQVDVQAYRNYGIVKILKRRGKVDKVNAMDNMNITADTGVQIDCISVSQIGKFALRKNNVLRSGLKVDCENQTDAGIIGVFFGKILSPSQAGICLSAVIYVLKSDRKTWYCS